MLRLTWLSHNLVITRHISDFKLLITAYPESQKIVLMQLIVESLDVYFSPTDLSHFNGIRDDFYLWVFENCSSTLFTEELGNSTASILMSQLIFHNTFPVNSISICGQSCLFEYGRGREWRFQGKFLCHCRNGGLYI